MDLIWTLQSFNFTALIDILLIAGLLFAISFLFRGTQAIPVLRGTILVVVIIAFLSSVANLIAFRWLSGKVITGAAFAIPVIFQPEIRRAMERLGRVGIANFFYSTPETQEQVIQDICTAAGRLSERRHGALIVLERGDALDEFIETGIRLNSDMSPQLLLTLFYPKTELHDGAVIIRDGRITGAACVLPLSAAHGLAQRKVGTRHRAGLGMTEISDAVVVIVSEETGQISVATEGRMIRRLDSERLETVLHSFYDYDEEPRTVSWETLLENLRAWYRRQKARLLEQD